MLNGRRHGFPLGNICTTMYDAAGRVSASIDQLARRTTYTYDVASQQKTRTDARGIVTTYSFDQAGRLTGRQYTNDATVTFSYDANRNRLTMQDGTGATTYTYDALDRKSTVTNQASKVITYGYDAASQRASLADPDGGRFTYSYDGAGRLSNLRNPQADLTTWTYDAANQPSTQTSANGLVVEYSFDAAGRLQLKESFTAGPIYGLSYFYDNAGNRTGWKDVPGLATQTTWTYDKTNQLTSEQRGGTNPFNTSYTYDGVGNRLLKSDSGAVTTSTYDAANQLQKSVNSSGVTTYTYDLAGNEQIVQSPSGITTSTWDNENRQTRLVLPTGVLGTFSYNADGQRFQKQDSTGTARVVWDGQAYLSETDGSNATQVEYTNAPSAFTNLVSQRRLTGGIWVPRYHAFDGLGSTYFLTDSGDNITDQYVNKAFGELFASTGSTVNPFQWVGQFGYYRDADSGLYYVLHRVDDPVTGRWTSLDPVRDDRKNPYRYVRNNPTGVVDPSGLTPYADVRACLTSWKGHCFICAVYGNSKSSGVPPAQAGNWVRCAIQAYLNLEQACVNNNFNRHKAECRRLKNCYENYW